MRTAYRRKKFIPSTDIRLMMTTLALSKQVSRINLELLSLKLLEFTSIIEAHIPKGTLLES